MGLQPKDKTECYQVLSANPEFTAGLLIQGGRCTEAAPIIKYLKGWTIKAIQEYGLKRCWVIVEI
jgi:hypothetical protein